MSEKYDNYVKVGFSDSQLSAIKEFAKDQNCSQAEAIRLAVDRSLLSSDVTPGPERSASDFARCASMSELRKNLELFWHAYERNKSDRPWIVWHDLLTVAVFSAELSRRLQAGGALNSDALADKPALAAEPLPKPIGD